MESSSLPIEKFTGAISQLSTSVNQIKTAANQIQATIARKEIRLSNLENDHYGDHYRGEGQEVECWADLDADAFKHENDVSMSIKLNM